MGRARTDGSCPGTRPRQSGIRQWRSAVPRRRNGLHSIDVDVGESQAKLSPQLLQAGKQFVDADLSERGARVIGVVVGQVPYPGKGRGHGGSPGHGHHVAGLERRRDILQAQSYGRPLAHTPRA